MDTGFTILCKKGENEMDLKKNIIRITRFFSLFAICTLFTAVINFTALASELPPEIASKVTRIDGGSISLDAPAGISVGTESRWNPGDGPAPQVTKILIYDIVQFNDTGNLGIITKVWGYGKEYPNNESAEFNGSSIPCVQREGFIDYGIGIDGFYHLYDCNVPVAAGNYTFYVNYKSDNPPYRQLAINYPFSLVAN